MKWYHIILYHLVLSIALFVAGDDTFIDKQITYIQSNRQITILELFTPRESSIQI